MQGLGYVGWYGRNEEGEEKIEAGEVSVFISR